MKFLTIKEAAEALRVSESFLYKAVKARKIPVIRLGKMIRIDLAHIGDVSQDSTLSRSSLTSEEIGTAKSIPRKEPLWE